MDITDALPHSDYAALIRAEDSSNEASDGAVLRCVVGTYRNLILGKRGVVRSVADFACRSILFENTLFLSSKSTPKHPKAYF